MSSQVRTYRDARRTADAIRTALVEAVERHAAVEGDIQRGGEAARRQADQEREAARREAAELQQRLQQQLLGLRHQLAEVTTGIEELESLQVTSQPLVDPLALREAGEALDETVLLMVSGPVAMRQIIDDYRRGITTLRELSQSRRPGIADILGGTRRNRDRKDRIHAISRKLQVLVNTAYELQRRCAGQLQALASNVGDYERQIQARVAETERRLAAQLAELDRSASARRGELRQWVRRRIDGAVSPEDVAALAALQRACDGLGAGGAQPSRCPTPGFAANGVYFHLPGVIGGDSLVDGIAREALGPLMRGDFVLIPAPSPCGDTRAWYIRSQSDEEMAGLVFAWTQIYQYLHDITIPDLELVIIDPEGMTNGLGPFRPLLGEAGPIHGGRPQSTAADIHETLVGFWDLVQQIDEEDLQGTYHDIYERMRSDPGYVCPTWLLVVYDFPSKAFDQESLDCLAKLVERGSHAGVDVIIVERQGEGSAAEEATVLPRGLRERIQALSNVVEPVGSNIRDGAFSVYRKPLPDPPLLAAELERYRRIFETQISHFDPVSPLADQLMGAASAEDAERLLDRCAELRETADQVRETAVADLDPDDLSGSFTDPDRSTFSLGTVWYPANAFGPDAVEAVARRFGLEYDPSYGCYEGETALPWDVDLRKGFRFALYGDKPGQRHFVDSAIWSFLLRVPVGTAKVALIDSGERAGSAVFHYFHDRVDDVFGGRVLTEPEEVGECLHRLSQQVNHLKLDLFKKTSNVVDYNLDSPRTAEDLTLLVVQDYPRGITAQMADDLENIIRNGGPCGIETILAFDPGFVDDGRGAGTRRFSELAERYLLPVLCSEDGYAVGENRFPAQVAPVLSGDVADAFADAYKEVYEEATTPDIPIDLVFERELPDPNGVEEGLKIPIGVGRNDHNVCITFNDDHAHGLITGSVGSGKTTLLHTIILNAMRTYRPDELALYLLDFKEGVEFGVYDDPGLKDIRYLAPDPMREVGQRVLRELREEMTRRGDRFRRLTDEGYPVASLRKYLELYRKGKLPEGQPRLPRILVIIDEFHKVFSTDGNRLVAQQCGRYANDLLTLGRSFGIHLLLSTQTAGVLRTGDLTIGRNEAAQMLLRISLKGSPDELRMLVGDEHSGKAYELSGTSKGIGTGVIALNMNDESSYESLRVAHEDDIPSRFPELVERDRDVDLRPTVVRSNIVPPLLDHYMADDGGRLDGREFPLPVGERLLGGDVELRPKSNVNTLVFGDNEPLTRRIVRDRILETLLDRRGMVYCIDASCVDGGDPDAYYTTLAETFPNRFAYARTVEDIFAFITDAHAFTDRRVRRRVRPLLVIDGLQRLDVVQRMLREENIDEFLMADEEEDDFDDEFYDDDLDDDAFFGGGFDFAAPARTQPAQAQPVRTQPVDEPRREEDHSGPLRLSDSFSGFDFGLGWRDGTSADAGEAASETPDPAAPEDERPVYDGRELISKLGDLIRHASENNVDVLITTTEYAVFRETLKRTQKLDFFPHRLFYSANQGLITDFGIEAKYGSLGTRIPDNMAYYEGPNKEVSLIKPFGEPEAGDIQTFFRKVRQARPQRPSHAPAGQRAVHPGPARSQSID